MLPWTGRSARGKERIHQGAERTHRIGTRAAGLAYDEDLNGTQLAEIDSEIKVPEDASDLGPNLLAEVGEGGPGDVDAADLRQVNVTGTIDFDIGVEIDLSPHPNPHLIAGSDHVIGRHRDLVDRGKGGGNSTKEFLAIDGKDLAGGGGHQFLKLSERLRRGLLRRRSGLVS